MENNDNYLNNEISSYKEDIEVSKTKLNGVKFSFAEEINRGLGQQIKKSIKPKSKIKQFFDKLFNIYG